MAKLTVKQEAFCNSYIEAGNASEAYRRCYDVGGMNANSIGRKAFELMENVKVTAKINELRADIAKRNQITVDDLIKELEEARQAALTAETAQSGAAVSATMGKAKLLGMDKQIVDIHTPNGIQMQVAQVSDDELAEKLKSIGLGRSSTQLVGKIANK